jgi:hypothetical protein
MLNLISQIEGLRFLDYGALDKSSIVEWVHRPDLTLCCYFLIDLVGKILFADALLFGEIFHDKVEILVHDCFFEFYELDCAVIVVIKFGK